MCFNAKLNKIRMKTKILSVTHVVFIVNVRSKEDEQENIPSVTYF